MSPSLGGPCAFCPSWALREEGPLWRCKECGSKAAVTHPTWGCLPEVPCVGLGLSVVFFSPDGSSQPHPHTQRWGQCGDNELCVCAPGDTALQGWVGCFCRHPWSLRPFKYKRGAAAGGLLCCLWKFTPLTVRAIASHRCWPLKRNCEKKNWGVGGLAGEVALQPYWKPLSVPASQPRREAVLPAFKPH